MRARAGMGAAGGDSRQRGQTSGQRVTPAGSTYNPPIPPPVHRKAASRPS